jgi:hypothetical protein
MRSASSLVTVLAFAVIGCSSDLTVPDVPEAGGTPDAGDGSAGDERDGEGGSDAAAETSDDAGSDAASDAAVLAPEDYVVFSLAFSRLYCRRVFSCCNDADRAGITAMDDEETCVRKENDVVYGVGEDYLMRGVSFYDRDTATACFTALTNGPCSAVFSRENGRLLACQGVLKGLTPNGGDCEGDIECLSGRCGGNGCAPAFAAQCTADQFFDGKAAMCVPRHQLDGSCFSASDCVPGLTCLAAKCATPLADGQKCISPKDCAGTCTMLNGNGVCRPGLCGGS